jgi:kumamolisin
MRMLAFFFAGAIALVGCSPRVPGATPNPRLANAIDLGKLSPDAQLDLVIGLQLRNVPHLGKVLREQTYSHDTWTPVDFGERFGVSAGEYAQILTWLRAHGLTVTRELEGRTTVSVRGCVANIERAFNADIHSFSDGDGEFFAATGGWSLAPEMSWQVSGLIGLDGEARWGTHMTMVPQAGNPNATSGEMAADIESMYNTAGITNPGEGETVVILGAGLAPSASDVSTYVTNNTPYGLSAMKGTYTVELVGGANRDDASVAQNEQFENTLDIEMVAALAPYANVYHVITATNTPGLFADGIAYIINKHASAHSVSVSYGTCERGAAGLMPVMNAMFLQAKMQGQNWFFAAGDTGSDGCRAGTTNKIVSAGYPASSPYVIGVGGTQIEADGSEAVWNNWNDANPFHPKGAGGGGPSESMDKPAYQDNVTPADGARDEPDVAALAGPPFVNTVIMGTPSPVAGTSAAAPMWAAIWALLEQGKNHTAITDIHEKLYALGAQNATNKVFNSITVGNNGGPNDSPTGGYPAGAGYNLATGWGSPNVANLISSWK